VVLVRRAAWTAPLYAGQSTRPGFGEAYRFGAAPADVPRLAA